TLRVEGGKELFGYPPIATLHWGLFIFRPAVWGYNASILFSEYIQTCGLRGCIYFTWKFAKHKVLLATPNRFKQVRTSQRFQARFYATKIRQHAEIGQKEKAALNTTVLLRNIE
ncbi:MAG: hypothetical protein LBJ60_01505, partial [Tannerellaceae bacterium]|nr:hypothetical protein [Tannerellaceae bacterium]